MSPHPGDDATGLPPRAVLPVDLTVLLPEESGPLPHHCPALGLVKCRVTVHVFVWPSERTLLYYFHFMFRIIFAFGPSFNYCPQLSPELSG